MADEEVELTRSVLASNVGGWSLQTGVGARRAGSGGLVRRSRFVTRHEPRPCIARGGGSAARPLPLHINCKLLACPALWSGTQPSSNIRPVLPLLAPNTTVLDGSTSI